MEPPARAHPPPHRLGPSLALAVPAGLLWWAALGWALLGPGPVSWALVAALVAPPVLGAVVLAGDAWSAAGHSTANTDTPITAASAPGFGRRSDRR